MMEFDQKVKELLRASGGAWGGTEVDRNFMKLLGEVFGTNFINHYQQRHPHEWLQFLTNFERTKKSFQPDGNGKISLPIPFSLSASFSEEYQGKRIDKHLKESTNKGVTFGNGMIVIKSEAATKLFKPVIGSIIDHTKELLRDSQSSGMNYIFMVGGFSECQMLQEEIKNQFERNGLKVLVPSEAQLAIIKGAVIFGHLPQEIDQRLARYSYGFRWSKDFNDKTHDPNRLSVDDDGRNCDHIFKCIVKQREMIHYNESHKKSTVPSTADQDSVTFVLFRKNGLPDNPVQYTDVDEMTRVGEVMVDLPGRGWKRKTEISFKFGGTEIEVEAHNIDSGNKSSTTVDFLA